MYIKKIAYALIFPIVAGLLFSCGGAEERKAKYLAKSQEFYDAGNYEKAKIEVKNVLQIDPKSSEGYLLRGKIAEKMEEHRKAFSSYSKAAELDENNVEAKCRLGRYYQASNQTDEAKAIVAKVLNAEPQNECGNLLNAAVLYSEKQLEKSAEILKGIIEKNPSSVDAVLLLQHVYTTQNKRFEAVAELEKALLRTNNDIQILQMLSTQYSFLKEYDKFIKVMNMIISKEPGEYEHRAKLSAFLYGYKKNDEAENILIQAIADSPDDNVRYVTYARFVEKTRGLEQAIKSIENYANNRPDANNLRFLLASLYLQANDFDMAETIYKTLLDKEKIGVDAIRAQNAIADLSISKGDHQFAEKIIENVLKENASDIQALKLRAKILLSTGKVEDAILPLRTIFKEQPDSIDIAILLSQTHLMLKEYQLGMDVLKTALQYNPWNKKLIIKHAELVAANGDIAGAIDEIDNALAQTEYDIELLKGKTEFLTKLNDSKRLSDHFKTVIDTYPEEAHGYYQLGLLSLRQKNTDEAIKYFEKALEVDKTHVDSLAYIVNIYSSANLYEKAISRINDFINEGRSKSYGYNLIGELEKKRGNYPEAIKAFQASIENAKKWSLPYGNLGHTYFLSGDTEKAESTFLKGLEIAPTDSNLLYSLGNHYESIKQYNKSIDYYLSASKGEGNIRVKMDSINNLAYILIDKVPNEQNTNKALGYAEMLSKSNNVMYMDTAGWIKYKTGNLDEAQAIFERIVNKYPADKPFAGLFNYHLGLVYIEKGEKDLAIKHLSIAKASRDVFEGKQEIDGKIANIKRQHE